MNEVHGIAKASPPQSNSINRLSILESMMEESEPSLSNQREFIEAEMVVEPRKARTIAVGVADLMRTLKPRKKGQTNKVKKKQISFNDLGGQSSSILI